MPEAFHLLQKGKLFTRLKYALSKKNYEEGKIFFGEGKKIFSLLHIAIFVLHISPPSEKAPSSFL